MLLTKQPTLENKVISMKLITGEELIAKCISYGTSFVEIQNPLSLVLGNPSNSQSQAQVAFVPWLLGIKVDQIMKIDFSKIIIVLEAGQDATRQYNQAIA